MIDDIRAERAAESDAARQAAKEAEKAEAQAAKKAAKEAKKLQTKQKKLRRKQQKKLAQAAKAAKDAALEPNYQDSSNILQDQDIKILLLNSEIVSISLHTARD